jgi:hypothetical protein
MAPEEYRFDFSDSENWKAYLKENGFVVIKNYLSQETCSEFIDSFWALMETLAEGRLDRNDPSTQVLGKNYPPVLHGGMIQYVGHSEPQWKLRTLCKPIFETLWDTDKLKSSFDGFCFMNGRRNYKAR